MRCCKHKPAVGAPRIGVRPAAGRGLPRYRGPGVLLLPRYRGPGGLLLPRYRGPGGCGPVPIALSALLIPALLSLSPSARSGPAPGPLTTVTVRTREVYYTLPRWCVGAKMTRYASDFAGGGRSDHPERARMTTPDGKTWLQCIQEMGLGFIGASMAQQGRPPGKGQPDPGWADWARAAAAVVRGGGGIMIEYMAGVGPPPGMPGGTTTPPEVANNVDPSPDGAWSVQNCLDWASFMAGKYGRNRIRLAEFYNEPATMNDLQMGSHGGAFWYSHLLFKNYDRLCADWATNHQQDYYKPFKTKFPGATVCGGSYSDPAGRYNAGEAPRYLSGYAGARVSRQNPNTLYQDALSLHCYGFQADAHPAGLPTAAEGGAQALFNSIFYPKLKQPGIVSGYRAGVDQWLGYARPLPGGDRMKLVDTEWWVYSPRGHKGWYPAGGAEGSHQAVGDVLGLIVHCQNADRWRFNALSYHAVNVCSGRAPDAAGKPTEVSLPDSTFCEYGGKLWRLGRYFAIRDICARFANGFPRLARCAVAGPASPAGPRDNSPGTQIQACSGLSGDAREMAVCLANIGYTPRRFSIAVDRPVQGAVHGIMIPPSLNAETPLPAISLAMSGSDHRTLTGELPGYTAALVVVPIAAPGPVSK